MILDSQILAISCKVEPSFSFAVFPIRIGELGCKMSFVAPLRPCLSEVCTNRSGGFTNLIGQGKFLFCGPILTQLKDVHRQSIGTLIDPEILRRPDLLRIPHRSKSFSSQAFMPRPGSHLGDVRRHPTSDIGHPTSDIRHRASDVTMHCAGRGSSSCGDPWPFPARTGRRNNSSSSCNSSSRPCRFGRR